MKDTDAPTDLHEWISFEDPGEQRTWVFDATFLTSSWTCIYGRGCLGVLTGPAPELEQGCCSYGAHLVDADDEATTAAHAARLGDDEWQFRAEALRNGMFTTDAGGARVTRLIDGACIFLNRPGFPGGAGCALHAGALTRGERPMDAKPDVCWQLPLRLEERTDDYGYVTSILREWKRRDWGEGGAEFHWWCTEGPEAFVGSEPVYRALREEITEYTGDEVYALLVDQLEASVRRGTPIPHPAVRRR